MEVAFSQLFPESIKAEANFYLEQYTGIKDKNGKEIYEGDIIRYIDDRDEVQLREVLYQIDSFGAEDSEEDFWRLYDFVVQYGEVEVVGNIHDNSELLGGEE